VTNAPDPRSFFPTDRFGDVREVVTITEGLSGATVYSVATETGSFVLRIQDPSKRASWLRMIPMQRLAAQHGIAPELLLVDDERLATVSVKISGAHLGLAASQPSSQPAVFASLCELLAKLHALPIPEERAGEDSVAEARTIWSSQRERPGFPAWVAEFDDRFRNACSVIENDPRRVLGHNDLNPVNGIWDGNRVWLVDWERAGPAHPYVDVASLSIFLMLPDGVGVSLLSAQERATLDARQVEVFRAVRDYARLVYGAVFFRLVPDLTQVDIGTREGAITLWDCYQQIVTGALDPRSPAGQARLGTALFRQCE
jgi:thiamine kinase-like enzyme